MTVSLLNFMNHGEVNMAKDELTAAEDLKVKVQP